MTSLLKQTQETCTTAIATLRNAMQQLAQTKTDIEETKKRFIK